ncbi:PREDICTED: ubiquitin-conjugating enzyme E2 W-like [Amphimedon queenslandica]|uniref:N-terminal E2 ubiquitin-conjugating enzyme n=2 Tax=Amphimedon queenslandica TaxID=400682 RepID=A0AAN0IAB1_AMPQE|nr:PREDICTED: ubiquitin-conjugating enzyme E2 W-like [Amphimedon queenslandica]|eukprot:XP_003383493.2 PREDICTED: ubiquitin-conjugating enzyme E2 W-like [Amphimedon queenslandica]
MGGASHAYKEMAFLKRLKKEYMELKKSPPPGVVLDDSVLENNITNWIIHISGAEGTLYSGEQFKLNIKFNDKYPFDSPQVTFIKPYLPVHPHVYSNGHICLSILDRDWSPALNVSSICLSILSMLSSCTQKVKPDDDSMYMRFAPSNPKKTTWVFHDDSV